MTLSALPIPQSLQDEHSSVLRRMLDEAYRKGYEDASARVRQSLEGGSAPTPPSPYSAPRIKQRRTEFIPIDLPPLRADVASYGSVINPIRHVLWESSAGGVNAAALVDYCKRSGIDTTIGSVRDCLKRLRAAEEAISVNGMYLKGPRLKPVQGLAVKDVTDELDLRVNENGGQSND